VSKSRHDSYREWGEYRKQRELTKDFANWKHEAIREMAVPEKDELYSVYIITNEWASEDSREDMSEVVDGKWFATENEAWDALKDIADSFGLELDIEETSFDVPKGQAIGLVHDTYYIQELTK
jgi:hypothetical protein